LVVVAIAQLMVVLDSTIVNIALPSAQRALGFPNSDRQWVVTASRRCLCVVRDAGGNNGHAGPLADDRAVTWPAAI
jgi:hypothetical protein